MYFLPRTNKIFSWLVNQQVTHLYIGSFLILTMVLMSWFFFVYAAIDAQIDQLGTKLRQLQNQKIELAHAKTAHETLQKRVATLENDFKRAAQQDTIGHSLAIAALPHVVSAAQGCKIALTHCALENQTDAQWYTQTQVSVTAQGTMDHIKQFFSQLQKEGHMVKMTNLTLNHDTQGVYTMHVRLDFIALKNS